MNKEWVLFNLKEAQEELNRTISEIENEESYDVGEFVVAMGHLYHHLNTAWNSQKATNEQVKVNSEIDFFNWRQFPKDIYLGQ
ncbi:MAG: hypothetical protein MUE93_07920 [Ignavibacteriaceae bacterium]|jgi:hypothetical protein|nr:hypothetical protein [Ignavibacteriaceae bacterium]